MTVDRRDQEYLGDGVYVAHDGYQIWLRPNDANWGSLTNEVALEPPVLMKLFAYAARMGIIKPGEV